MSLTVGEYTYGHTNIHVHRWDSTTNIIIGKFCSIATGCNIYAGGNHRTDFYTTYPFGHINKQIFPHSGTGHPSSKGDIIIGNDVWIGGNVTIMSGVTIGDGAVIANNSHVVKNIEPYTIVGGNPARFIRNRFDPDTTQKLLDLQWWNLPHDKIVSIVPYLCSTHSDTTFNTILTLSNIP